MTDDLSANIDRRPFPDAFAILPSETYVFDQLKEQKTITQRIVGKTRLSNGMEVVAVNMGLLGFNFAGTSLGGFERLDFNGSGQVPQSVIANRGEILSLQIKRMRMAMFVTACIYGVHAERSHSGVEGALYPGLSDIYAWGYSGDLFSIPAVEGPRLVEKLSERRNALNKGHLSGFSISKAALTEGLAMADRVIASATRYVSSEPTAMMGMTYQAMILHSRQHAGASIALSAVVVEAAVEELMHAYGIVEGATPRLMSSAGPISRSKLRKLGFGGMIDELKARNLLDAYLAQRVDKLRQARNSLMHDGEDATPEQSGEGLTVVRDIPRMCLNETKFSLNSSWSYRY